MVSTLVVPVARGEGQIVPDRSSLEAVLGGLPLFLSNEKKVERN